MASQKKNSNISKLIKIVLGTFLFLTFGVIFLYHGARFYFSIPYNPNHQPLVQPVYKELYIGSMWNVKPNQNNILAFREKTSNLTKIIIFDVSTARFVSAEVTSIFDGNKAYISGPYWESDARVTFPVLMDSYSGTCTNMYVSQAPDWRFTIEPCNPSLEGKTSTSDFIRIPDREEVMLPVGSDMRGISVEGITSEALVSPQGDLYAIEVRDRFHKTFNEGNSYISDVRLIDKKGCTIAQIGSSDKYGMPEAQPIGWTNNGDLVVHRHGWLKDRLMGLFLVSKAEIEKMKNSSRCYK